jgi:hypothetical protein
MKTVVEVYVRSFSIPKDIESLSYAQQHAYCAPGMVERTLGLPGFSGRVLEPDSAEILSLLDAAQKQWGQRTLVIEVYDVGRLRGRLKAMKAGVWRTPAVAVNGEKRVGLPAAREMFRDPDGG